MSSEFRVFISSTFRDLQAERDYLLKNIFPRIRQLCRERGVEFTEIDLRWGVTEEEAVLGRVIRSCLEEIDRCRPYFIGILGERYGWTPPLHVVQKDGDLLRKYPWIEDAVLEEQSLLELEFTEALLLAPAAEESIVFYRKNLIFNQGTEETETTEGTLRKSDLKKLEVLRERVAAHGCATKEFSSAEELGAAIQRHLIGIIDRDFPADAFASELHEVQLGHEAFAASRRQAYIAEPALLARLTEHADGAGAPLVIASPSGYGKSALLAFWIEWYRRKHPDAFVIAHFVGVGAHSEGYADVIKHCILEIKERFGIDDAVPNTAAQLEEDFSVWLARTGDVKLILVIDAINQLGVETAPAWLPRVMPEKVRLIVSTIPGAIADAFAERGWQQLAVAELSEAQRESLIVRFFGEYHKGLNAEQCKRIARNPNTAVPLYLRMLLEELRLSGSFELLDGRIDHYLAAQSLEELFQRVLERMETDHGGEMVRRVLSAVWAARRGLREEEIAAATGLPSPAIQSLMRALEYHMLWRNGLRTFFHEYLRDAVEARYCFSSEEKRSAHARLAAYFATQPLDARRADEEPWQWKQAEEWSELHKCLVAIPMFAKMYSPDAAHELLGYWLAMGERYDMVNEYSSALERYHQRHPEKKNYARLCNELGNYFSYCSKYDAAETLLTTAVEIHTQEFGEEDLRTVGCLDDLGGVLYYKGKYDEAETMWRRALAVREKVFAADDPALCESLDNLTAVLYARGKYKDAEILCYVSLKISQQCYGPESLQTSSRLNNLASVLTELGQPEQAMHTMAQAVSINRSVLGGRHPGVGRSLMNLGVICMNLNLLDEAEHYFRASLEILEPAFGRYHDLVALGLMNLAGALHRRKLPTEALACYDKALGIYFMLHGEKHSETLQTRSMRALVLEDLGKVEEARNEFEALLPLRRDVDGETHPRYVATVERYIKLLKKMSRHEEAAVWAASLRADTRT